jgi:hypothetical protein
MQLDCGFHDPLAGFGLLFDAFLQGDKIWALQYPLWRQKVRSSPNSEHSSARLEGLLWSEADMCGATTDVRLWAKSGH